MPAPERLRQEGPPKFEINLGCKARSCLKETGREAKKPRTNWVVACNLSTGWWRQDQEFKATHQVQGQPEPQETLSQERRPPSQGQCEGHKHISPLRYSSASVHLTGQATGAQEWPSLGLVASGCV